jgi:hypothetical protein
MDNRGGIYQNCAENHSPGGLRLSRPALGWSALQKVTRRQIATTSSIPLRGLRRFQKAAAQIART